MQQHISTLLLIIVIVVTANPAQAFDNDFDIDDINLNEENFLDINAHRFRKSLEYQWYDNTTGWRINGASLDGDLAFINSELKLESKLSEYVKVRFTTKQEVFYADQDILFPTAEVELYPWAGDLGIAVLGTPAYEKREMDLGFALIWGKRPWNYTRFEYLDIDALYNEKNFSDNTFYKEDPKAIKLEGAYLLGAHYKLRFSIRNESQLELIDPDNSGSFKHERSDYSFLFDYLPTPGTVLGITIDGFSIDKSQSQVSQEQRQSTDYISADIYWVMGMGESYEISLGTQYDQLKNDIRDYIDAAENLDYHMKTLQIYGTVYHPFDEHMAWDFGLYAGQVEEEQDYLSDSSKNTLNDGVQAKFRMGFEYSSSDGENTLQLNISLNMDDPFNDPGDGAGISYQSVF